MEFPLDSPTDNDWTPEEQREHEPPYQLYRIPVFVECLGRDADEARSWVEEALNGIDSWNELLEVNDDSFTDTGPIVTVLLGNIEEVENLG